jgi:glycosyltransferase involved in cell wall biosynthesis
VYDKHLEINHWDTFKSILIESNPKVSVIIPTLNRYSFLKNILNDLEKQTYKNFEVVIIDQSEPFNKDFYNEYSLEINSIYQEEKALWLARNTGIKVSKSDYVLFCEDDIRVPIQWIENHIKALDFFNADISTGVFFPEFSQIPKQSNFFRIAEQFSSGNALVKKSIFKHIGLFDRQFEKQRMGDAEFGMRAYLEGFLSISNPYAYCEDVKAPIGGLRQMGSWDAFRPKSFFSPRPIPSVLYYYRKYFGNKSAILSLMKNIPPSLIPYKYKRNSKLLIIGSIVSILFAPLIIIQVFISWKKSTIKLKQGNTIEYL